MNSMARAVPVSGMCRRFSTAVLSSPQGAAASRPVSAAWARQMSSHSSSSSSSSSVLGRRPAASGARRAGAGAAAACKPQSLPAAMQRRTYKTVEEAKSRQKSGPFSWKAGVLFILTGAGLVWYFESEKKRMQQKRIAEANKGMGRPKVGGPFSLIDQNGNTVTDADLKGRHSLVYFGFSHCPDICPEELDKMARMVDLVDAAQPGKLLPVFVTCDPARDTPEVLKAYLAEFHPRFIGLTGTHEQIKAMCKAYRVYFSTPPVVAPGQDYLVDHSIYFYLMDPDGDFVEALGRQHSPEQAAEVITGHIRDYRPAK